MSDTLERAPRDWRDFSTPSLPPLLQSSLVCFVTTGYHAATTRTLAAAAGLSVPGLYHYYPSKQDILVDIMEQSMEEMYSRSLSALLEAGESVEEQFRLLIECYVLFHAHRADLARIALTEIRGLEPEARARHMASRDRQQQLLDRIVEGGVSEGIFHCPFPHDASRAIVTMCAAVARWYRADGGLSPDEVARRYVILSLSMLNYSASSPA